MLPRVERWSIWNEPNQPGWLTPQYESKRGRKVATRRATATARSSAPAITRAAHVRPRLATRSCSARPRRSAAPAGSLARRPIPPADVHPRAALHRPQGPQGRARRRAAAGSRAWPSRASRTTRTPAAARSRRAPTALRGEITISHRSRLKRLLTQARPRTAASRKSLPICYTEFGYQTNPPDRLFGVSLEQQAEYINESDWIAYQDSRIKSVAQYKLVDEPNVAVVPDRPALPRGELKPAFDAYRLPIWVTRQGSERPRLRPGAPGRGRRPRDRRDPERIAGGSFATVQTVEVSSRKGTSS